MAKIVLLLSALSLTGCMTANDKILWDDFMKEEVQETAKKEPAEAKKEDKVAKENKSEGSAGAE